MGSAEKCPEQYRIGNKGQEVSIRRSNCSNGVDGAEAWGMRSAARRKVNVLEMKCLRSLVGESRMDRVRRRAAIEQLE